MWEGVERTRIETESKRAFRKFDEATRKLWDALIKEFHFYDFLDWLGF